MMNLKEQRLKKGLTQCQIAAKMGISLTTYQLWERQAGKPNPENAKKLKEVLDGGDLK